MVFYSLDLAGVTLPTTSSQRISRDGETRYQLSLRSWAEGGATRHQAPSAFRIKETPSMIIRMPSWPDIEVRRAIFMLLTKGGLRMHKGLYFKYNQFSPNCKEIMGGNEMGSEVPVFAF